MAISSKAIKIILSVAFTLLFFCVVWYRERFETPTPTFDISFLRATNATQKIIKPSEEKIFPTNFRPSGMCMYPEQCPNPKNGLWGRNITTTTTTTTTTTKGTRRR